MLPSREAASKLPFEYFDRKTKETLRKATPDEVRKAFDIIERQKSGKGITADSFDPGEREDLPNIRIRRDDINAILIKDLHSHVREVRKMFPNFHELPPQAQMSILDMHFNMGGTKFTRQRWPEFFKAINAGDWAGAATESSRKDVGKDRNDALRNMLEEASRFFGY